MKRPDSASEPGQEISAVAPEISEARWLSKNMGKRLLIFILGLVLGIIQTPIRATGQLNGAQQRDEKHNPSKKSANGQDNTKTPRLVPPPDPSPYTGDETRKNAQENISIQQDVADSSRTLARYTIKLADYTWA